MTESQSSDGIERVFREVGPDGRSQEVPDFCSRDEKYSLWVWLGLTRSRLEAGKTDFSCPSSLSRDGAIFELDRFMVVAALEEIRLEETSKNVESEPRLSRRLFVPRNNIGIVRIANRHDLELTLPQFLECHEPAKKCFVVVQIGTHRRWVVQRVAAPNSSDLGNVYRPSLPVAFFAEKLNVFVGRVEPVNVGECEQSESLSEIQVLQGPGDRSGCPRRFKCLL